MATPQPPEPIRLEERHPRARGLHRGAETLEPAQQLLPPRLGALGVRRDQDQLGAAGERLPERPSPAGPRTPRRAPRPRRPPAPRRAPGASAAGRSSSLASSADSGQERKAGDENAHDHRTYVRSCSLEVQRLSDFGVEHRARSARLRGDRQVGVSGVMAAMRPIPLLVALALSLATLAGCGDGDDDGGRRRVGARGPRAQRDRWRRRSRRHRGDHRHGPRRCGAATSTAHPTASRSPASPRTARSWSRSTPRPTPAASTVASVRRSR